MKQKNFSILKLSFVLFRKHDFEVETSYKMLNARTWLVVMVWQRTGKSFFSDFLPNTLVWFSCCMTQLSFGSIFQSLVIFYFAMLKEKTSWLMVPPFLSLCLKFQEYVESLIHSFSDCLNSYTVSQVTPARHRQHEYQQLEWQTSGDKANSKEAEYLSTAGSIIANIAWLLNSSSVEQWRAPTLSGLSLVINFLLSYFRAFPADS